MTDPVDHVLAAIDHAVWDVEASPDAMRWSPEPTSAPSERLRFSSSWARDHVDIARGEALVNGHRYPASAEPPILDHIPPGTRPYRYACMTVAPEAGQRGVEFAREELIHQAGERPHVVTTVDAETACRWFGWGTEVPGARVVAAIRLEAIPGALEHIVIRRAADAPADAFPGWEGRWQTRPPSRHGVVMLAGVASSDLFAPVVTVEARSTGRIEMREDGALAEVFEYRSLPEHGGSWQP